MHISANHNSTEEENKQKGWENNEKEKNNKKKLNKINKKNWDPFNTKDNFKIENVFVLFIIQKWYLIIKNRWWNLVIKILWRNFQKKKETLMKYLNKNSFFMRAIHEIAHD